MSTSTFRDYAFESFGGGVFSIETSGEEIALLSVALNHPELTECFTFDRATARDLGTKLLRWSHSATTLDTVEFAPEFGSTNQPLRVDVVDGTVMFLLQDGTFQACDEEVIDLAQRLIVWAGVNVTADING